MNTGVLTYHSLARSPFEPATDFAEMFQAGSRTELVRRVAEALHAGAGVLAIKGGPGVGKTSLSRVLASTFCKSGFVVVEVGGAMHDPAQLQQLVGESGNVRHGPNARKPPVANRLVLLVDDAHAASRELLGCLCTLVENRTAAGAETHLVLLGDVGSWRGLDAPDLDHLRQACASCYFLLPFRNDEAAAYLDHAFRRAGQPLQSVMTPAAVDELIEQSQCVPAQLNDLTTSALTRSYRQGVRPVTLGILRQTTLGGLVADHPSSPLAPPAPRALAAPLSLAALGLAALTLWSWPRPKPPRDGASVAIVEQPPVANAVTMPMAVEAKPGRSVRQVTAEQPKHPGAVTSPVVPSVPPRTPPATDGPARPAATEVSAAVLSSARLNPISPTLPALSAPAPAHAVEALPQSAAGASRRTDPHGGPGLVLVAAEGDDMPKLYARVYRGVTPPPYATVIAANTTPIRPGALVIFPEPPRGWPRR